MNKFKLTFLLVLLINPGLSFAKSDGVIINVGEVDLIIPTEYYLKLPSSLKNNNIVFEKRENLKSKEMNLLASQLSFGVIDKCQQLCDKNFKNENGWELTNTNNSNGFTFSEFELTQRYNEKKLFIKIIFNEELYIQIIENNELFNTWKEKIKEAFD